MDTLPMTSSSVSLPPLQNLPQWPRIHTLDRGRYPKPFVKDQIQVLPPPPHYSGLRQSLPTDIESVDTSISTTGDMDALQRVSHLEKSMAFLRRQHEEILISLHSEIEALKRENKELHFRVIMARGESPKKESSSSSLSSLDADSNSHSQAQKLDQVKSMFMEEKIKELNGALQESRSRNAYLQRLLKDAVDKSSSVHEAGQQTSPAGQPQPLMPISTNPLQVQKPSDPKPRSPTLQECEIIIRHLKDGNERQAHELLRLKSDLRDVLYSHKWTPDAYLLAKAYVAEDEEQQAGDNKLPKIPLRNSTRKLPEAAFTKDTFSLPPLKTTMGKKVAERQKRVDAVKRARQQRNEVIL
ncbi:coiled-coil domain-containing protein 74A-like [Amphiura filiformis]|uniref:coiled-coil domain-containing protein 74A-like n=1 Tax=Amphiura filiformis TaxID=82378 RepID=UPI003B21B05F